jgi:hypothetical protein
VVGLHILGMLFFFSITLTFLIVEFAAFFNEHTLPNLSLLINNAAFLISGYFGTAALLNGINISANQQIIRWIRLLLVVMLMILSTLYILFISRMPATLYFTPQSLPEVVFRLIVYFFSMMLCVIVGTTHLIYFPSEKFTVIRLRAILMILCMFSVGISLLIRTITFGSYLWPFLMSPVLIPLFYVFLIISVLLFFLIFLSDKLYARFVITATSIESWRTLQDLQCLVKRLLLLCPVIGMPAEYPNFWRFVFNPEYYLYRAVIIILDSKAMLVDFLAEVEKPGMGGLWEPDEQAEAARISAALEAANPSNDFSDIVETYRRVSRELFVDQKGALAKIS